MIILSLSDFIELRDYLSERGGVGIHLHDACGAQSFSLDSADEDSIRFITEYFADKGQKAVFTSDKLSFTLKE
ncbi:MAG: hypothetical protein AB9835_07125 [Eubacteriales bacterium]